MSANKSGSMPCMFFYPVQIDMILYSIKLLFCNVFIGLLIVDQLFFGSINTLDFTNKFSNWYQSFFN